MSTSSPKLNSSDKRGEATLILEHVEMLLSFFVENQIEKRFEKLDGQIEQIIELIADQKLHLETFEASPGPNDRQTDHQRELEQKLDAVADRFSEKTDTISGVFKSQIEQMFEDLGASVTKLAQGIEKQGAEIETPSDAIESVDDVSHWEKQKEAMLSKYGIDPEYRPAMDPSDKPELPESSDFHDGSLLHDSPEPAMAGGESSLSDSVQSLPDADAAAIEELKEKLNAQLREAEVELSISRAKISQQQAELELEQVELERRAKMIDEKFSSISMVPAQQGGFFGWIWRHLKPKRRPIDDRA